MDEEISRIISKLSNRRVLARKEAIRELKEHLCSSDSQLGRLALHYVSEHDPVYTVRNIARQAFYMIDTPPEGKGGWERAYLFHRE